MRETNVALEERFRLMADSAPVMLWMSGADGLCTYFNRGWLAFTGRTMGEELGDGWAAGVHADDRVQCVDTYMEAFSAREPFSMEYRLRRHDGEYRWVLDHGVPSFDPDGHFEGYIGSAIDVTKHRLAEDARADLNQKLLRALEAERARIARELHDDFAQRIALMALELDRIVECVPDPDLRSRVRQLYDRAVEFSRDLAQVSHRLHSAKLQHLGLAGAAAGLCDEVAAQYGLSVSFVEEDVPTGLPDEITLNLFRILQEALTNAARYSGAPELRVALIGGGDGIRLEIADRGVGFDVEACTRGRGLGLLSMRERATLMGGELSIRSSADGTRVSVRVPFAISG